MQSAVMSMHYGPGTPKPTVSKDQNFIEDTKKEINYNDLPDTYIKERKL